MQVLRLLSISLSVQLVGALTATTTAQDHCQHHGKGQCRMGRMGTGGNQPQDMKTIHVLFDNHKKINRAVKNIEKGIASAYLESFDPVRHLSPTITLSQPDEHQRSQDLDPDHKTNPISIHLIRSFIIKPPLRFNHLSGA